MQGWLVSFVLVLMMCVVNFGFSLYAMYKTDEIKFFVAAVISIIIGAFQVGFIINFLMYIWPVMNGR